MGIKAEVAERKLPGTLYWVDLAPLPGMTTIPLQDLFARRRQLQDRRAALSCGHRRCDPGASRRTSRRGSCECAAAGGEPAGEAALNGSAKRGSLPLRTEGNLRRRVQPTDGKLPIRQRVLLQLQRVAEGLEIRIRDLMAIGGVF